MIMYFNSLRQTQGGGGNPNYDGELSGTYITDTHTHASTIDPSIDDITYKTVYDSGVSRIPILVIMHGWSGTETSFEQATYERFASYGFFVLGAGKRVPKDASARELHDIIDAVEEVKVDFNSIVDVNRVCIAGYSGGGGNTLGLYVKFPDYFNLYVDHFGMSDYGFTGTSWHTTDPSFQSSIETAVGDTPANLPNEYRSRNARQSITNFGLLAPLRVYHDTEDASVDVLQSQALETEIGVNAKFTYNESTIGDPERWEHGYPRNGLDIIAEEANWKDFVFTSPLVNIPNTGSILVSGYIVTKKFSIWLGNGTDLEDGTNRSATVVYDVLEREYTVTPLLETGATDCEVKITQGIYYDERTISSETIINL